MTEASWSAGCLTETTRIWVQRPDRSLRESGRAGVIDPTLVVRAALQDAASVAGLVLTTEVAIVDFSDDSPASPNMSACRRLLTYTLSEKRRAWRSARSYRVLRTSFSPCEEARALSDSRLGKRRRRLPGVSIGGMVGEYIVRPLSDARVRA